MKLDISDELADALRDQLQVESPQGLDDMVGGKWFIRTVTNYLVGMVVKRSGTFLILKDAAWVADSGRFMQAIKDGTLNEVEPVGSAIVNVAAIVDAFPWVHPLPKAQK